VELMVVIAIIAILTALAVPAFKGLVGVSGIRGGTDAILGAIGLAQSRALESGTNTYIAFPPNSFSRFIVLQSETTNILSGNTTHTLTNPIVLTPRWFKLPTGVQLTFSNTNNLFTNLDFSAATNIPPDVSAQRKNLPQIDGSNALTLVRAIRYNRFGSLPANISNNVQLIVGEGFSDGINPVPTFTGTTNTRAIFTAHQLVGKWIPATNN
jgi:type II secretory pathway pseudopilin PulG